MHEQVVTKLLSFNKNQKGGSVPAKKKEVTKKKAPQKKKANPQVKTKKIAKKNIAKAPTAASTAQMQAKT